MAYDNSGSWSPEDDSTANRIAAITSGNSSLMQQARTSGLQAANRRGLGNSSMAVGAAQNEVIRAAAPIASQDAQQAFQKNLTNQQGVINSDLLTRNLASNERQQIITATTDLTGQSLNALAQTLNNDKIPSNVRSAVQGSINDRIAQQQRYIESLYGFAPAAPAPPNPALNTAGGQTIPQSFAGLRDAQQFYGLI